MQRRDENNMVIISCDFCGADWDEVLPMIEGHHGSILCLECLKAAVDAQTPVKEKFQCTLCLRQKEAGTPHWRPQREAGAALPEGANEHAAVCADCIEQAAGAFSKDEDVDWSR